MFVDTRVSVVDFHLSRFLSLFRFVALIILLGSSTFSRAQVQMLLAPIDELATSESLAWPTTGTVTAKHIGDGVWWRPVLNETSVTQVLTDLNSWGVPNLYLDVFRSGHTLFPSDMFPQLPEAQDRDWLSYIISEAHKHNIRVHAWVQVLCWQDPENDRPVTHPLLIRNPHWLEVSVDGYAVDGRTAARFVSPGVAEIREALLELTRAICRYPVDGLNLDSLHYNARVDSGYNAAVVRDFITLHGVDPAEITVDHDEGSDWMKWVAFREDNLTSVVQLLTEQARETGSYAGRRILVSATVQPDYEESRGLDHTYQHWQKWLDDELLDVTIPECFNSELPELEQQLWEARSMHMGSSVACIPGLQVNSQDTSTHPPLKEQKRLLRNAGFQHCTVMDYDGLRFVMENPEPEPEDRGSFWDIFRRDD